jgi:hypothetical protein
LVWIIDQTHRALLDRATRAVNVNLTLRNWLIGYHIAEFELRGTDRAVYGDRLLAQLARELRARRISTTGQRQLYGYLAFYRTYPQIVRTASAKSGLHGLLDSPEKVRTASAPSVPVPCVDPELLLVFYHRVLKCHVLVELKNDRFRHEHLSQLNTYVAWYKQHQMTPGDQPPIGILLRTHKNHELVEYALADMSNTLFVSRYQVQLPDKKEIAEFVRRAVEQLGGEVLDGRAACLHADEQMGPGQSIARS